MLTERIECFCDFLSIVWRWTDWHPKIQIVATHVIVVTFPWLCCCGHHRPFRFGCLRSLLAACLLLSASQIWHSVHDIKTKELHLIPLHLVIMIDSIYCNLWPFEFLTCSSCQRSWWHCLSLYHSTMTNDWKLFGIYFLEKPFLGNSLWQCLLLSKELLLLLEEQLLLFFKLLLLSCLNVHVLEHHVASHIFINVFLDFI